MKVPALALAAFGAAMLAASAAPASADAPKEGTLVSFADLDLGTAAGRAELNQRYDQAARNKCGMVDGEKANSKTRYCYKTTGAQYRHFADAILAQHDRAQNESRYGLAAR